MPQRSERYAHGATRRMESGIGMKSGPEMGSGTGKDVQAGPMQGVCWNDLKAFLACADHADIADAARELGVAVADVRKSIRSLEAKFGQALAFVQHDRLIPTRKGKLIIAEAQAMAFHFSKIRRPAAKVTSNEALTVRVGVSNLLYHEEFLNVVSRVLLEERHSGGCVDLVFDANVHGRKGLDITAGLHPARHGTQDVRQLGTLEVGFFAHETYRHTYGLPSSLDDLRQHRFLVPDAGFMDGGPNVLFSLDYIRTNCRYTELHAGVSVANLMREGQFIALMALPDWSRRAGFFPLDFLGTDRQALFVSVRQNTEAGLGVLDSLAFYATGKAGAVS